MVSLSKIDQFINLIVRNCICLGDSQPIIVESSDDDQDEHPLFNKLQVCSNETNIIDLTSDWSMVPWLILASNSKKCVQKNSLKKYARSYDRLNKCF